MKYTVKDTKDACSVTRHSLLRDGELLADFLMKSEAESVAAELNNHANSDYATVRLSPRKYAVIKTNSASIVAGNVRVPHFEIVGYAASGIADFVANALGTPVELREAKHDRIIKDWQDFTFANPTGTFAPTKLSPYLFN
jgi:hypothetical protein